ncbi:hypothetical protein [Fulvivirga ligni]|uniref:hypothetical protein n=1 Tax=Fulvivirga ligni TaxID=2904246 RepID=UPI001F2A2BF5|nr:hypothetical protein [Fulvivirga ligni]UII20797.1 hypothetical protein LVD16_23435 [Fulvivirga ligni]
MNDQNVEYLKERLFYLGFQDHLNKNLEEQINKGKDKFQITTSKYFNGVDEKEKIMNYELSFSQSKKTDLFFLYQIQATLLNGKSEKSQAFYINNGHGLSAKEMFNLLEGRSVYKLQYNQENQPYKSWLKLNMAQKDGKGNFLVHRYHENWGFNLEKSLNRYPIKELQQEHLKQRMIRSLEKGNLQKVTIATSSNDEKTLYLMAYPQGRMIHAFNEKMKSEKLSDYQLKELKAENKKEVSSKKSKRVSL